MLTRHRGAADDQLQYDENRDAALTLAELHMAKGMRAEAERLMAEMEADEPVDTAASSSDISSIMRRASILRTLGQQVICAGCFPMFLYPLHDLTLDQGCRGVRQARASVLLRLVRP